jgi:hypothetical protein
MTYSTLAVIESDDKSPCVAVFCCADSKATDLRNERGGKLSAIILQELVESSRMVEVKVA